MWWYGDENLKKWRARYEWSCWTIESNAPSARFLWAVVSNCLWAVVISCIWCKTLLAGSWFLDAWLTQTTQNFRENQLLMQTYEKWPLFPRTTRFTSMFHHFSELFKLHLGLQTSKHLNTCFFFFRRRFLKPHIFWLRGAEHHFFEFRSITSGACLGRSTDSRTRIWQFARPVGLRIGGWFLSMVTPYSSNILHVWQDFLLILRLS